MTEQKVNIFQKVEAEKLQNVKIMVATPMYGGNCTGSYTQSMMDLMKICTQNGIELKFFFLYNESLIQRARNYCADEFLRSDCTHLVFIDADISFNPLTLLQLIHVQLLDPEKYDIVAAPYPKKSVQWGRVAAAAHHEIVGPDNVNQLEYFAGDMAMNFKPGTSQFRLDEPIEVLEAGTGFMCIPRATLEKWIAAYPEMSYKPDHIGTKNFDGSRNIHAFFHCDIDPKTGRYLSEDYYFCQKTVEMGGRMWILPWAELHHTGTYVYKGSIAALGMLERKLKEPHPMEQRLAESQKTAAKAKKKNKLGTRP